MGPTAPNPDPKNFKIEKVCTHGNYVLAKIHYPDCTNYEGRKVLLFEGVKLEDIVNSEFLDPHFCDGGHISPVARFTPDEKGWQRGQILMGLK